MRAQNWAEVWRPTDYVRSAVELLEDRVRAVVPEDVATFYISEARAIAGTSFPLGKPETVSGTARRRSNTMKLGYAFAMQRNEGVGFIALRGIAEQIQSRPMRATD